MWEARHFCVWYIRRTDTASFKDLSTRDVDTYFEMCTGRRKSPPEADRIRHLRPIEVAT
jgi:hypothetical protein